MSIAWEEGLTIGDPQIDADHRRMVALVARLEAAAEGGVDCEMVGRTLAALAHLCRKHFAREEALQREIGFPDREVHRDRHDMLSKRLDALLAHYAGGGPDIRRGMVRTLGDSLATWLINHIANEDVHLKPYVARRH
jgi:hemerythrin